MIANRDACASFYNDAEVAWRKNNCCVKQNTDSAQRKKGNYFIWFIERKSFLYVNLSTKSMSSSGCSTWLLFNPSIDGCIHWSSGFAFRFRTGRRIQVLPGHFIWTILAHILAQKIWTIYWPISNIVIKEKPMQSPKIPPQLAMNQIIGTWKRNKIS